VSRKLEQILITCLTVVLISIVVCYSILFVKLYRGELDSCVITGYMSAGKTNLPILNCK